MELYQGTAASWKNLWVKFSHRHPMDIILILEEGNQHKPQWPQCDMFVPQEALNQEYLTSEMCQCRTERKQRRLVSEETEE